MKLTGIGAILILAALLTSCGGNNNGWSSINNDPADATLAGLTVSVGTLAPVFSPATAAYTLEVLANSASIDVTATTASASATMTINGSTVPSGTPGKVSIPVGGQTTITILVTAANGTTLTYTIAVTRPNISLTPAVSTIPVAGTVTLTVALATTSATDTAVSLDAVPVSIISMPASVTVAAGQTQATFVVTGASVGTATVSANMNPYAATTMVNVN